MGRQIGGGLIDVGVLCFAQASIDTQMVAHGMIGVLLGSGVENNLLRDSLDGHWLLLTTRDKTAAQCFVLP